MYTAWDQWIASDDDDTKTYGYDDEDEGDHIMKGESIVFRAGQPVQK
jgi:hypothetical protein